MRDGDGVTLRRAGESDLAGIREVWLENAIAELSEPPSYRPSPSFFRHEIETGETWVAERAGRLLGFAAILPRHGFVFLAEMFVRPRVQSRGIGRRLLACVAPVDGRAFCTLSSTDPRAHALYLGAGMRPLWPRYTLRAQASEIASRGALATAQGIAGIAGIVGIAGIAGIEVVEADRDDPEFHRLDGEIGNIFDRADHAFWIADRAAVPLWFRRDGERIGYGYVQMRDDESFLYPEAATIGPLGTLRCEDGAGCAAAAVTWACARAKVVQITVPGPHPALGPMVEAGFEILYVETFYASAKRPCTSFERYLV